MTGFGAETRPRNARRAREADRAWSVGVVVIANAWLVVVLWVGHGGLDQLDRPGGRLIAAGQLGDFVRHYPDVLMSFVGLGVFVAIGVTAVRAARRRLSRETWYTVHLYAYLAVALSFAHQLAVGTDFSDDAIARTWWCCLYIAVFGAILGWRVGRPVAFNLRHKLRVEEVRPEADGIVSLYIARRQLERVVARPGQFFLFRFGTGTELAKAHPFSLSAPPDGRHLRITIKDVGDDSHRLQHVRPGLRVLAEGPYGTFTADRQVRGRAALIAGGIGITPLRAMMETMPAGAGNVILLYRAANEADVAFKDELAALADQRGIEVHQLIGPEIGDDQTDRLGIPALRSLVPDIAVRDVFVCGPPAVVDTVRHRLAALKVLRRNIHFERFAY